MKKQNSNHSPANDPTHAQIAALAHFIYEEDGCIPGSDEANWHAAKSLLREQIADGIFFFSNDDASRDGSRPRLELSTR